MNIKKKKNEPNFLIKKAPKARELTPAEQAKGRTPHYHSLSPREQWAEDKRLGILDWEGE